MEGDIWIIALFPFGLSMRLFLPSYGSHGFHLGHTTEPSLSGLCVHLPHYIHHFFSVVRKTPEKSQLAQFMGCPTNLSSGRLYDHKRELDGIFYILLFSPVPLILAFVSFLRTHYECAMR